MTLRAVASWFPSRGALRNGVRLVAGFILAASAVVVFYVAAERRPDTEAKTPTPPSTAAPTSRPPRPRSGFPSPPDIRGRSYANLTRDPAVRQLYAPFAASGRMNFVRAHRELVETDGPSPMSFRWMRAAGHLDSVEGFIRIATSPKNDRPHWPTPVTESDWSNARTLFALYDRLGPLWDADSD